MSGSRTLARPAAGRTWTRTIMGSVASLRLVTSDPRPEVDRRIEACFAELARAEEIFSPFLPGSDISRIRRGEMQIADAHRLVSEVACECRDAEAATEGRFSAWRDGRFDPTGYVKGWAVERAAARHLAPLLEEDGCRAVGLSIGGDMQLLTADGADWTWRVGIPDPESPSEILATIEVVRGAVATSGSAERGGHIVDPRSGETAAGVASATVVTQGLGHADVWATAAVVSGFDDLSWLSRARTTTGLLVSDDGRTRRWVGSTEVSMQPVGPFAQASR